MNSTQLGETKKKSKILIVDDDEKNLKLMEYLKLRLCL